MSVIRFINKPDICLAFRFEKVFPGGNHGESPTVSFDIVTASMLLGFDENGKFTPGEKFIYIDGIGTQVDEFDEATFLAAGSVFPNLYPEIEGNVGFMISLYADACFSRLEFKSFSEVINSEFLTDIYKELQ